MALPINIKNLLRGDTVEWVRIELKKFWDPTDIVQDICAFANDVNNWDGGYIIIGVEEVNGIAKLPPLGLHKSQIDSYQKKLIELSKKIAPDYFPQSQPYEYDDRDIFIIWVPAGDNRPYQAPISLSDKKTHKTYFIRKGSSTIKVQPGSVEERKLFELASRIPFDDRVHHTATISDLKLSNIQAYLQEIGSALFEEMVHLSFSDVLSNMKIVKGPPENLRPTNAGILFFNDQPETLIPGAQIDLVIHRENVGKEFTEIPFKGPIHKQIKNVLAYFKNNIIQEQVIKIKGEETSKRFYNYPFEALEEIIPNAVFHKSYEYPNLVEIQVHPDKIEVLSFPGPLPPIDNKALKRQRIVARDYRNRKVGEFLKELHLTEGRGTGFPIIHRSLRDNGSPEPVFETDEDRTYFFSYNFYPS